MKTTVIGTCKLCLRTAQELKESHLMPAGVYRRLLSADKNPHPIVVTKQGSRSSAEQVTDHVLCAACESRFDALGENYALKFAADRKRFRLLQELEASPLSYQNHEWRGYKAADTPHIQRDQLGYFGLSVFWRAAVHRWPRVNGGGRTNKIILGAKNSEALRQYLLSQIPMPSTMTLFFVVLADRLSQSSFYLPTRTSKGSFRWGNLNRRDT